MTFAFTPSRLPNLQLILRLLPILFLISLLSSCEPQPDGAKLQEINQRTEDEFAPDKRVAVYEIELISNKDRVVIQGETDQVRALEKLEQELQHLGLKVDNKATILPDQSVGDKLYAVVNNSVANMRSQGKHSAELATQAILGMGLKVLKIEGDFFLVQSPDHYIAWVDHGGVTLMTEKEFRDWTRSAKIIYLQTSGKVYANPEDEIETIGDLVLGASLKLLGETPAHYRVEYPDGRQGYVPRIEAQTVAQWTGELEPTPERLELYARSLMGSPYLWGGTSSKGMDCSGFTKTVYFMNGFIIPRDASQQVLAGKEVDPDLKFEDLKKGDLLFFGKKATDSTRQRVTHVGIWLGNDQGEFIHASGRVKIGSVLPGSQDFDALNTERYLGSRRYLGEQDPLIAPISFKD